MDMSQHPNVKETARAKAPDSVATENARAAIFFAFLGLLVAGWAASGVMFGAIGLAIPALALVPVAFILIVMITLG